MTPADFANTGVATSFGGVFLWLAWIYLTKVIIPESDAKQKSLAALPDTVKALTAMVEKLASSFIALGEVSQNTNATANENTAQLRMLYDGQQRIILSLRNGHESLKVVGDVLGDPRIRELIAEARGLLHAQGDDSAEHRALTDDQAKQSGPPSGRPR